MHYPEQCCKEESIGKVVFGRSLLKSRNNVLNVQLFKITNDRKLPTKMKSLGGVVSK
jgi:hypothetical protein